MTLALFEGFDALNNTSAQTFYTTNSGTWGTNITVEDTPPAGRLSTGALKFINTTSGVYLRLPPSLTSASLVVGMAVYKTATSLQPYVMYFINESDATQVTVQWITAGNFRLFRGVGGTTVATTANTFAINQWHYLEVKITIADAGSYDIRVNGVSEASGSADTRNVASSATIEYIHFAGGATTSHHVWYDDIYILNQGGSAPWNNFLGDCTCSIIRPDGAGNSTTWTPSAGSNFQNVDDTTSDSDTTYNSTGTPSNIDLFTLGAAPATTGTIYGIQEKVVARKTSTGDRIARPIIRTNSTNYEGSDFGLSPSYVGRNHVWEQNPNTAASWTISDVNGLEAGVKLQS